MGRTSRRLGRHGAHWLERNAIATATRTVTGAAALPDLLGEFAAAVGRGGPDDGDRCRNGHRIGFAPHAQDGAQPLPETHSALVGGIVLYR